ncbi:alpha/beta-hydrolase family protein [Devosia nitrariae]|uniref:alpha/beta-hydrolase family protein n=1 Tax=Devosia nitrariae TaxID=2071872 RepID=UPI003D67E510
MPNRTRGPIRLAFLQYPSDPIVFFGWSILYQASDWLAEPRGAGVSPAVSWHPLDVPPLLDRKVHAVLQLRKLLRFPDHDGRSASRRTAAAICPTSCSSSSCPLPSRISNCDPATAPAVVRAAATEMIGSSLP